LLAPVPSPPTIFCAGANYADHAAAMARKQASPSRPIRTSRAKSLMAFHQGGAHARRSGRDDQSGHYAKELDWEIELAAVIGRPAKDVPMEKALNYVAGYTVANDLSARDRGRRPGIEADVVLQDGLEQAQELRRLLPARAVDRTGERHRRPADSSA
jgi:2-keto-4-pentenoate hydratase/2-oxohepta-3-ene-1,7-dioic acid hydratase in catechol pathway